MEFTTAGDGNFTGWRIFNDEVGGWTNLTNAYKVNEWNKIEISYNKATTGFDFYINGQLAGSNVAIGSKDLGSVIFNNYNYGPDADNYNVHWSNFALGKYLTSPVTKDDCKNDNYKAFGFKNQGQCVSSVVSKRQ